MWQHRAIIALAQVSVRRRWQKITLPRMVYGIMSRKVQKRAKEDLPQKLAKTLGRWMMWKRTAQRNSFSFATNYYKLKRFVDSKGVLLETTYIIQLTWPKAFRRTS